MDKPNITVIGTGKLGSTLALVLAKKGYSIQGLCDSDPGSLEQAARAVNPVWSGSDPSTAAKGAEIVILTVPDDSIKAVSDQLASRQALSKGQVLCHCSGFLPSAALVANKMLGASIASMHPLASFSRTLDPWGRFQGIYFGIEGDAVALSRIKPLVESLECCWVNVRPSSKGLYHLSGVMASNYLAALLYAAAQVMGETVLEKEKTGDIIRSLAGTVLDNISQNGPETALSGPIERGDALTVAGHLEALRKDFPQGTELYKVMGRLLLQISRRQHPERVGWEALSKLLDQ